MNQTQACWSILSGSTNCKKRNGMYYNASRLWTVMMVILASRHQVAGWVGVEVGTSCSNSSRGTETPSLSWEVRKSLPCPVIWNSARKPLKPASICTQILGKNWSLSSRLFSFLTFFRFYSRLAFSKHQTLIINSQTIYGKNAFALSRL